MLTLNIDAVEASSLLHTMTSPVVGMEVVIAPAYYRIIPSRVQSGIGAKASRLIRSPTGSECCVKLWSSRWLRHDGIRAVRKRLDNARDLSRFRDWDADLNWLIEHERQRGTTRQPDLLARGRQHNRGAAASAHGGTNRGALLPADDSADDRSAGRRNPDLGGVFTLRSRRHELGARDDRRPLGAPRDGNGHEPKCQTRAPLHLSGWLDRRHFALNDAAGGENIEAVDPDRIGERRFDRVLDAARIGTDGRIKAHDELRACRHCELAELGDRGQRLRFGFVYHSYVGDLIAGDRTAGHSRPHLHCSFIASDERAVYHAAILPDDLDFRPDGHFVDLRGTGKSSGRHRAGE